LNIRKNIPASLASLITGFNSSAVFCAASLTSAAFSLTVSTASFACSLSSAAIKHN
jgi:hypothetical protein